MLQETQRRQHCLLHTLNNLVQQNKFSEQILNEIADTLAPGRLPLPLLHPHRTIFLGNWDVSVLELAVESFGKSLKWHDQRDVEFEDPALSRSTCFGIVVNIKPPGRLAALLGTRHWVAIKKIDGIWYNLDSSLPKPQRISDLVRDEDGGGATTTSEGASSIVDDVDEDSALRIFLKNLQKDSDAKVFLII
jgi:hypothetical protein